MKKIEMPRATANNSQQYGWPNQSDNGLFNPSAKEMRF
jgi:hypothetical protein